jgi:hypothetical protein
MFSYPKSVVVNPRAEKLEIKPRDFVEIFTARGMISV